MIFQRDGALPDYANEVREYLDRKLPGRWMGRGGPVSWPACSPDLALHDYHLWGRVKDTVHHDPPQTINELTTKIREAIRVINEGTLKQVFKDMKTRLIFVTRQKRRRFRTYYELNTKFSKQSTFNLD